MENELPRLYKYTPHSFKRDYVDCGDKEVLDFILKERRQAITEFMKELPKNPYDRETEFIAWLGFQDCLDKIQLKAKKYI